MAWYGMVKKVRGSVAGAPLLVPGVPGRSIVPHLHILVLWLVTLLLVLVLVLLLLVLWLVLLQLVHVLG